MKGKNGKLYLKNPINKYVSNVDWYLIFSRMSRKGQQGDEIEFFQDLWAHMSSTMRAEELHTSQ